CRIAGRPTKTSATVPPTQTQADSTCRIRSAVINGLRLRVSTEASAPSPPLVSRADGARLGPLPAPLGRAPVRRRQHRRDRVTAPRDREGAAVGERRPAAGRPAARAPRRYGAAADAWGGRLAGRRAAC